MDAGDQHNSQHGRSDYERTEAAAWTRFENEQLIMTRRQLFGRTSKGIGVMALASLLNPELFAAEARDPKTGGLAGLPHFAPKAKRVIFLHQSGAPSQIDLFDYKPKLAELAGTELPDSVRKGQRITGMTSGQNSLPVAPSMFKFQRAGENGTWISELLPHTAKVVDDITLIKTMQHRRHQSRSGDHIHPNRLSSTRPRQAWAPGSRYGLGSENQNLPCVCRSDLAGKRAESRSAVVLAAVVERLFALEISGCTVPRVGRPGPVSGESAGYRRADSPDDARQPGRVESHHRAEYLGIRRLRRASRSTRWRTGCSPPSPI